MFGFNIDVPINQKITISFEPNADISFYRTKIIPAPDTYWNIGIRMGAYYTF